MKCTTLAAALSLLAQSIASPLVQVEDADLTSELVARDGTGSVTSAAGLSWYDPNNSNGNKGRSNPSSYTCFKGPAQNFPARSTWMNFNSMWALQNQVNVGHFNSQQQALYILQGIQNVSAIAKVDARVILAVIVLESSGNPNVGCTTSYGGIQNCGLMQSYNPTIKKFDPNNAKASIRQMIVDGTQGTAAGPGLVQWINHASDTAFDTQGNVYKALRGYNSGAINLNDLSDGKGATWPYVSHIANYLQGWDGSSGDAHASACGFPNPKPTPTPTPTPTACVASKYVAAPTQTVSGSTKDCCKWYTVKSGDTCDAIDRANGISLNQFRSWNTYVNSGCTNIFANYAYCVSSNDPVTVSAANVNAAQKKSSSESSSTSSTKTKTSSASATTSSPSSSTSKSSSKSDDDSTKTKTSSKTSSSSSSIISTSSSSQRSSSSTKASSTSSVVPSTTISSTVTSLLSTASSSLATITSTSTLR